MKQKTTTKQQKRTINALTEYVQAFNTRTFLTDKNSAEVDIAPAFGEITTACNEGQAKKGHGACLKSGQLVYARFHTHSHRCCREMYFDVNFLDSTQNIDKVSERKLKVKGTGSRFLLQEQGFP